MAFSLRVSLRPGFALAPPIKFNSGTPTSLTWSAECLTWTQLRGTRPFKGLRAQVAATASSLSEQIGPNPLLRLQPQTYYEPRNGASRSKRLPFQMAPERRCLHRWLAFLWIERNTKRTPTHFEGAGGSFFRGPQHGWFALQTIKQSVPLKKSHQEKPTPWRGSMPAEPQKSKMARSFSMESPRQPCIHKSWLPR